MFDNLFNKFKKENKENRIDNIQEEISNINSENEYIIELLKKIYSKQNKQNIVLDDILENVEEKINYTNKLEEEIKKYKKDEDKILELSFTCIDALSLINKYIHRNESIDEDWYTQINLIDKEINGLMSKCGIEKISKANDNVDTSLHQIVEVYDVKDKLLDSTVEEVLMNGYIYKGKILRKAKIIANVFKEEATNAKNNWN